MLRQQGMKLVANRRSTKRNDRNRADGCRNYPEMGKHPLPFSLHERGGGVELDRRYTHTAQEIFNFSWGPLSQIPNFLENKNRAVGLLAPALRIWGLRVQLPSPYHPVAAVIDRVLNCAPRWILAELAPWVVALEQRQSQTEALLPTQHQRIISGAAGTRVISLSIWYSLLSAMIAPLTKE
jgi:hypothetical protein